MRRLVAKANLISRQGVDLAKSTSASQILVFRFWTAIALAVCVAASSDAQQPGAIQDRQADHVQCIRSFFTQFRNKQAAWTCTRYNGHIEEFKAWNAANGMRLFRELPAQTDASGKQRLVWHESLYHQDGLFLTATWVRITQSPQNAMVDTIPSVGGREDWRESSAISPVNAMLLGYAWTGKRMRNLANDDFWRDADLSSNESHRLRLNHSDGATYEFRFESKGESLRLVNVSARMPDHIPRFGRTILLEYEQKITYDTKRGSLSGWLLDATYKDRESKESLYHFDEATGFDLVELPSNEQLCFEIIPVPEHFRTTMLGRPGVEFRYHKGRIKRIIDSDAVQQIDELLSENQAPQTAGDPEYKSAETNIPTFYVPYLRRHTGAAHCGIYAFSAAAAALGIDVPPEQLVERPELASYRGASIESLVKLAREYELHATPVYGADTEFLNNLQTPCLLHLGRSYQAEGTSHWVACLGSNRAGEFRILDLPHDPADIRPADLLAYWDGNLIAISDTPIDIHPYSAFGKRLLRPNIWLVFVAVLLLGALLTRTISARGQRWVKTIVLLLLIVGATAFWLQYSPVSYSHNPFSTNLALSKVPGNLHARVIENFDDVLIHLETGQAILVDCRLPHSFHRGNIPGSINLPVDASLAELTTACEKLKKYSTIIAYCNSQECSWADTTAARLQALGFDDVQVYRKGWQGFLARQANDKPL